MPACRSIPSANALFLSMAVLFAPSMAQAATAPSDSYLKGMPPGIALPDKPDNSSDTGLLDLYLVRLTQEKASDAERNEAYDDAASYYYYDLLPRFSQAAGMGLSIASRPVLSHMLKWALADVGFYAQQAKEHQAQNGGGRARPYAEDNGVTVCNADYLKPQESYPSGHSANGYTAALVIGEVMPSRRAQVMSRGTRYGDNRVLCAAHHPIDVERGRQLARSYFEVLSSLPAFRQDVGCATEEDTRERARAAKQTVPVFSSSCASIEVAYRHELAKDQRVRDCATWSPGDADRPRECSGK